MNLAKRIIDSATQHDKDWPRDLRELGYPLLADALEQYEDCDFIADAAAEQIAWLMWIGRFHTTTAS